MGLPCVSCTPGLVHGRHTETVNDHEGNSIRRLVMCKEVPSVSRHLVPSSTGRSLRVYLWESLTSINDKPTLTSFHYLSPLTLPFSTMFSDDLLSYV